MTDASSPTGNARGRRLADQERRGMEAIRRQLVPWKKVGRRWDAGSRRALAATDVVETGAGEIRQVVRRAARLGDERARFRLLFDFVRDEIRYEFAPLLRDRHDFEASRTLRRGDGFCVQKAVLLTSLARAADIPALLGFQRLRDHKLVGPYEAFVPNQEIAVHGFNAVRLGGRWIRVDATLDRRLCTRRGYRLVEMDGDGDRILPRTDLVGRPHFDVLEELGFWDDLPATVLDFMMWWVTEKNPGDEWRQLVHRHDLSM